MHPLDLDPPKVTYLTDLDRNGAIVQVEPIETKLLEVIFCRASCKVVVLPHLQVGGVVSVD